MGRSSSRVPARAEPGSSRAYPGPEGRDRTRGRRLRVVLADDHPVVRAGLRHILDSGDTIEVVAEAEDGRTLLRRVQALSPDVVVMDVSMPELNGIEATRAIRRQFPTTRVLVLSVHGAEAVVLDAVAAGAAGYLLKETATEELQRAVSAVARGEGYFSPGVAGLLVNRLNERARQRPLLSARDREVVQLISEGERLGQIAAKLFVSIATVKSHRANAMRKLSIRTTADLIRYAIRGGLSPL